MTTLQTLTNIRTANSERLANAKETEQIHHLSLLDYFLGKAIEEVEAIREVDFTYCVNCKQVLTSHCIGGFCKEKPTAAEWFAQLGELLNVNGALDRDMEELEREEAEYIQQMADRFGGR
jgi:hypothetical protein